MSIGSYSSSPADQSAQTVTGKDTPAKRALVYGTTYSWSKGAHALDAPESEALKASDRQVAGSHYKDCSIQPIEYVLANNLGFCEGNVVKYITRYAAKGGKEDLDKVIHYVELLKEHLYSDQ